MAQSQADMPFDDATLKQAIDDLANALQTAVLVSARLQAALSINLDDATILERALQRAATTLQRLQPR